MANKRIRDDSWVAWHMTFPADLFEDLRQLSFDSRRSRADIIRTALAAYLKKEAKKRKAA